MALATLVISNLLAFFQFLVDKFTLLDPDPRGKMNADPDQDPQPCYVPTIEDLFWTLYSMPGSNRCGHILDSVFNAMFQQVRIYSGLCIQCHVPTG